MSKKKLLKGKLKIVSLIALIGFSVISLATATFSWFFIEKKEEPQVENIAVVNDPEIFGVTYNVYGFNQETKEGELLYTEETGFNFQLNSFDSILGRNDRLSQIIEFTVTTKKDSCPASNIDVSIPCDANWINDSTAKTVAKFMSNVVTFRSCLGSYTNMNGITTRAFTMGDVNRYLKEIDPSSTATYETDEDKIYQEVCYELENSKYTSKLYVDEELVRTMPASESDMITRMKQINTKKVTTNKNTVNFTINGIGTSKVTLPANVRSATFYIQYDYSNILSTFMAKNIKNISVGGNTLALDSDFNYIKISMGKAS